MIQVKSLRPCPIRVAVHVSLLAATTPLWLPGLAHAQVAAAAAGGNELAIEEIVVTATRRAEPLSKVPISVSSFSAEQLDARGVKDFDDVIRLTPGLNLTRSASTGSNQVAIRGIASDAGSGTTGIYIDDTPIQVRNLGFGAGNAFPGLFDIDRVEVLRGPQGTLFGAGSEGGTVRFIQTQPSLTDFSTYARAEVATLQHGDPSYEAGAAFGGPISEDRVGFRLSAFYRREGGYIDNVDGTYQILVPDGSAYGNSVDFTRTRTFGEDVNWNRTVALRAALKFAVTDALTISPSVFHQKRHVNDGAGDSFDLGPSRGSSRDYSRQYYRRGSAADDPIITDMKVPNNAWGDDEFTLSAINLNWNLGAVRLVSNTSFFDRDASQWYDYTKGYVEFYAQALFLGPDGAFQGNYPPLGWKAMSRYDNAQQNFVQELRLESTDDQARLTWVAGLFYAHNRQTAYQPISVNFLEKSPYVGFDPTFAAGNDGAPYGPGTSAFVNFFGVPALANSVTFLGRWKAIEEQLAGFAQADFKFTDRLKFTLGLRYSNNKLDFDAAYEGPENNAQAPFGFPCVPGTYCETPADEVPVGAYPVGTGPFAPEFPRSVARSRESAWTPKVGVSFQLNEANMFYATAAKGFRPAGASLRAPSVCNGDLIDKGYVDADGNPVQPTTYDSDSVWSYEIGSKNRLLGGRLAIDASAYQIKWKGIQANVSLPSCSYNFVDNLADATSKGLDLSLQYRASEQLSLGAALGYNEATLDDDALSPNGTKVFSKGSGIPDAGAPFTVSLFAQYDMNLWNDHPGYVRADYTRSSEHKRVGATDPSSVSYDARLKPIPAYGVLNLRAGVRYGDLDVSVFVDNVTDAAPALNLFAFDYYLYDPQDWTNETLRPRTYGLTLTWRH